MKCTALSTGGGVAGLECKRNLALGCKNLYAAPNYLHSVCVGFSNPKCMLLRLAHSIQQQYSSGKKENTVKPVYNSSSYFTSSAGAVDSSGLKCLCQGVPGDCTEVAQYPLCHKRQVTSLLAAFLHLRNAMFWVLIIKSFAAGTSKVETRNLAS